MDSGTGNETSREYLEMYHLVGQIISEPDNINEKWNEINLIEIDRFKFGFNKKISCLPEDFPRPVIQLDFSVAIPWVLLEKPEL